ncbi:hypothetical protein D3C71_2121690 [compost metagenome]
MLTVAVSSGAARPASGWVGGTASRISSSSSGSQERLESKTGRVNRLISVRPAAVRFSNTLVVSSIK